MGSCFSKYVVNTRPISSSSESPHGPRFYSSPPRPPPSPPPIPRGSVLEKPYVDIRMFYHLERELGRGQFGITYLCTEMATGLRYACKSMSKRKLSKIDIEDVRREISIMQHLSGQPNIVEFRGAYEDRNSVHVVMELCSGGELFDRMTAKGSYTEREAARIGRQIVNVVYACHFMGVMHRDLKPENFLMASRDDNAQVKATDFGISLFIEEG